MVTLFKHADIIINTSIYTKILFRMKVLTGMSQEFSSKKF